MNHRLLGLSVAVTTASAGPSRRRPRYGRAFTVALLWLAGLGLLVLLVRAPL